jgi:hypothetical protein
VSSTAHPIARARTTRPRLALPRPYANSYRRHSPYLLRHRHAIAIAAAAAIAGTPPGNHSACGATTTRHWRSRNCRKASRCNGELFCGRPPSLFQGGKGVLTLLGSKGPSQLCTIVFLLLYYCSTHKYKSNDIYIVYEMREGEGEGACCQGRRAQRARR